MDSVPPITIKKEDDVKARPSLFPKRKAAIANIPPRARFAKARPNIGGLVNKAAKETPSASAEKKSTNVVQDKNHETSEKAQSSVAESTSSIASSQALNSEATNLENAPVTIKTEPELLPRPPVLSKRTTGLTGLSRSRYQKVLPNIGALASKTSTAQKNSSHTPPNETKIIKESPESKAQTSSKAFEKDKVNADVESRTPTARVQANKTISPVRGFSFTNGEMEIISEYAESIEKNTDENLQSANNQEVTVLECSSNTNEEADTQSFNSAGLSNGQDVEPDLIELSVSNPQTPEKRNSNTLVNSSKTMTKSSSETLKEGAVPSKLNEYPTLKSILNSPRKRVATKKSYERRRRLANLTEAPSRREMIMTDLIYYNPTGEGMKVAKPQTCAVVNLPADEYTKPTEEEPEDDSSNPHVPKVTIDENGEIVLDEGSLVVRRKETVDTSVEAIVENDNTTYSSFRKKSFRQWTKKETSKFYKALSLVGTDFALMESIFTVDDKVTRTRRELKLKFKREEKLRIDLVHKVMYETQTYDISILDEDDDSDDIYDKDVDDPPKPTAPKKRGRPKTIDCQRDGKKSTSTKAKRKTKKHQIESDSQVENDDTVQSAELDEEWGDIRNGMNNKDASEQDQASTSNKMSRPQRTRKNRVLSDYVSVNESENSDDDMEGNPEILTKKKPPDCSKVAENENKIAGISSVQKPRGRKKKVLPPAENIETFEIQEFINPPPIPEMEYSPSDVSQMGRVRRTRILKDFITDEKDLEEVESSDDESVIGVRKNNTKRVMSEDSNDECLDNKEESCILVEQVDYLPENSAIEIIEKVKEELEEPSQLVTDQSPSKDNDNQNVVFVSAICPTQNPVSFCEAIPSTFTNSSKSPTHNQSVIRSTDEIPSAFGQKRKVCDSQIECVDLEVIPDNEVVISESTMHKRRRRKVIAPNLGAAKRNPEIRTFSNFTPSEDIGSPRKETVLRTYSRQTKKETDATSLQMVEACAGHEHSTVENQTIEVDSRVLPSQNDQDLRTFQNDPVALSTDINQMILSTDNISETSQPISEPENNISENTQMHRQMILSTENFSETSQPISDPGNNISENDSFDSNQIASMFSLDNQTILGSGLSFPNSQAITLDSDGTSTDPPPVMIFTKSPNNENILHLFMVQP